MPNSSKDSNPIIVETTGGHPGFTGEGKRAADQLNHPENVGTKVVVSSPPPAFQSSSEPPWQASWPTWAKMTWSYGPFLIILLIYLNNEREKSAERREDRADLKSERVEEREMRRLEVAQRDRERVAEDRRDESLITELRAITARIDADRAKDEADAKARKLLADDAVSKISDLVKDMDTVLDALKRLKLIPKDPPKEPGGGGLAFPFALPLSFPMAMPAVWPEPAPMPRLVRRFTSDHDDHTAGSSAVPDGERRQR